jgi:hypothetical protein
MAMISFEGFKEVQKKKTLPRVFYAGEAVNA